MAATRYTVLTNGVEARTFARKERAVAEAEKFVAAARDSKQDALVQVVTTGGKEVFTQTVTAPAAAAPRKATGRKAQRPALGEAAVPGWELLYDKPRQGAQVARKDGTYALICTEHRFVRPVAKLVEERAVRKAGGWCTECSH